MNNKIKDLSGKRFGMITVLSEYIIKEKRVYWYCKCDCGKIFLRRSDIIQRSDVKSCGCYQKINNRNIAKTHGDGSRKSEYHRLYVCWQSMKDRCYNSNNVQFKDWGGRGITVCKEWLNDYNNFKEWALQNGYANNLTLDRIKVNENYKPSNCRWITKIEQNKNTRRCRHILYHGKNYTPPELAQLLNIDDMTVRYWLFEKNKSVEYLVERFKYKQGGDVGSEKATTEL
jgi:hypothetical protein